MTTMTDLAIPAAAGKQRKGAVPVTPTSIGGIP